MGVLLAAGCTADPVAPIPTPAATPTPTSASRLPQPSTALPPDATTVLAGTDAAELALGISRLLYQHSPAVVLVGEGDAASLPEATATALRLGVPLLLAPDAAAPGTASGVLRAELNRLGARTMVPVGAAATRWAGSVSPAPSGDTVSTTPAVSGPASSAGATADSPDGSSDPAAVTPTLALDQLLVLALDQPGSRAAVATAKASGARVLLVTDPDPRAEDATIKELAGQPNAHVLALGSAFGPVDRLRQRIDTAATGVALPGGRQVVFPGRRLIALYGHPGNGGLGVLGEQPLNAAINRAKNVAASYRSLVDDPVVPTFEIIATVASGSAGSDGNYSSESSVAQLRPWVDAARKAGVYVVLDLQPGRTDFLTQAKRYTDLLKQPHVGLALDPEWRLKPKQRHLEQIGSVSAAEINRTSAWLADLTRAEHLPQKVLMVHQFRTDMITNRKSLVTNHDELAMVIHVDGFGTRGAKLNTWNTLHINPPPNVWWGWKDFYDEDQPTFTPRQTVAVRPSPVFISYQ